MTRVDYNKFAVHSHVMDVSTIYEITDAGKDEVNIVELNITLDKALKKYLKLDKVELIKCGNGKRIPAEREQ
jgi:arginine deiminase